MSILPSARDGRLGQAADVAAVGHVGDDVFGAGGRLAGESPRPAACSSSSWRLEMTTAAPAWAKIVAMALPSPLAAAGHQGRAARQVEKFADWALGFHKIPPGGTNGIAVFSGA